MTYYDTGVLVKLYVPELDSQSVLRFVSERGMAIQVNDLQYGEATNAFALKAFRQEMSTAERLALRAKWEGDFSAGRLRQRSLAWPEVFQQGNVLTEAHSLQIGCRTLDILHVAAALVLHATEFVTLDDRQRRLALAAGLNTVSPSPAE
jgi:predicted nucleic acid-binding protein